MNTNHAADSGDQTPAAASSSTPTPEHTPEPAAEPAAASAASAALGEALVEIEQHVQEDGWDQQPRLYALAPTGELVEQEPGLAKRLGLKHQLIAEESLTPIEQDVAGGALEDLLPTISWPETVRGCALALERIVLPPGAEEGVPDDDAAAVQWAQNHPQRTDVRVVVGVLRDGSRTSVMRVRGHEADDELIRDAELSPEIGDALADTLT